MSPAPLGKLPVIGIPVDVKTIENKPFHAVGEKYIHAVCKGSGTFPVLIPANIIEDNPLALSSMIHLFDGIFLPGSVSNVHPERYGQDFEYEGQLTDTKRDKTTFELIRLALANEIPLLGACRGFQEMNIAMGGSLHQQVHNQEGYLDHREDLSKSNEGQYAVAHDIEITAGGLLASIFTPPTHQVNSLHGQGINRLADGLSIEATSADGLVEAFSITDAVAFSLGVQWHPEWCFEQDELSTAIFKAFGEAAIARQQDKHTNQIQDAR